MPGSRDQRSSASTPEALVSLLETQVAGILTRALEGEDLSASSGTTRVHSEGQWQAAAAGDSDGTGPSGADGDAADPGDRGGSRLDSVEGTRLAAEKLGI